MNLDGRVTVATSSVEGVLEGIGALLHNVAPLLVMCDPGDLQMAIQVRSPHTGLPTIHLWQAVPGGVGLSAHLFHESDHLVRLALELVQRCACSEGCPGCVGPPPAPGLGAKQSATEALRRLAVGIEVPVEAAGSPMGRHPTVSAPRLDDPAETRKQLRALIRRIESRTRLAGPRTRRPAHRSPTVAESLPGATRRAAAGGEFTYIEARYPLDHHVGVQPLGDLVHLTPETLALLDPRDDLDGAGADGLLFLEPPEPVVARPAVVAGSYSDRYFDPAHLSARTVASRRVPARGVAGRAARTCGGPGERSGSGREADIAIWWSTLRPRLAHAMLETLRRWNDGMGSTRAVG